MGRGIGLFQFGGLQACWFLDEGYLGNKRGLGGGGPRFVGILEVGKEGKCVGGGICIGCSGI